MADIAAADVTYTIVNSRKLGDSRAFNRVRLVFGDGALTVPAGGIPLTKGKLGCPTVIESMTIVDQGTSGYKFQYDQSEEKLVVMQAPAHGLFIRGGQTHDATLGLNTSILGKNTATNVTVSGAVVAAALEQATGVAIAAQTIEVEVVGW